MRMVVLFPDPFGPRKPRISPRFTVSERWSTATKRPKRFTRSLASMIASGMSGLLGARERHERVFQ